MIKRQYLLILIIILGNIGLSQEKLPQGSEEGIFELRYSVFEKDILCQIYKDSVYIPFFELMSFLKIHYNLKENNIIEGYIGTEKNEFSVNMKKEVFYDINGNNEKFNKKDYFKSQIEIYFRPEIISKIFSIDISIMMNRLMIIIKSKNDLPALEEEKRYGKYSNLNSNNYYNEDKILPVIYDKDWKFIDGGLLNYSIMGNQNSYSKDINYNTNLGIQLLGGDLMYNSTGGYSFYSKDALYNQNFRWHYSLGENNYLSHLSLGYISNMSMRSYSGIFDGSSNRTLIGLQLSNENTKMPTVYNTFIIDGNTNPGWQVELYVENRLLNFCVADNIGYYSFKVPVKYGYTNMELKFYGPKGEFFSRTEILNVPSEFLQPGSIKYNFNAGKDINEQKYLAGGKISIGITNWLTTSTDIEKLDKVQEISIINYTVLRIYGGLVLNTSFNPKHFSKTGLRFGSSEYGSYDIIYSKSLWNNAELNNDNLMYDNSDYVEINAGLPRILSLPFNISFRGKKTFSEEKNDYSLSSNFGLYLNPVSLNITHSANINEQKQYNTKYTNQSINTRVDYNWFNKPDFLSFLKNTRFSLGGNYIVERKRITDLNVSIQQEIHYGLNLSLNYIRNLENKYSTMNLSLMLNSSLIRVNTNMNSASSGENSFAEDASGTIGFNSDNFSFTMNNSMSYNNFSYGAAVVRFFIDKNLNGIFDKGEEEVPDVEFYIPDAQIERDNSGNKKVYNLISGNRYNLFVKKNSIKNPFIVPKYEEFAFIADPYSFKVIDVPCYMCGSIEGRAKKIINNEKKEQGGIKVHLINMERREEQIIELFSDGSFNKLGVLPGKYKLYVDSVQLNLLNCISKPEFINFEIKQTAEGEEKSNLDFELTENPKFRNSKTPSFNASDEGLGKMNDQRTLDEREKSIEQKAVNKEKTNSEKSMKKDSLIKNKNNTSNGIISGKMAIFEFEDNRNKILVEKSALENYMLKLSNGKDILYSKTDCNGKFMFENLISGKWTLGPYKGSIPKGYRLEQMFLNIEIKEKEKKEVIFKVVPMKY